MAPLTRDLCTNEEAFRGNSLCTQCEREACLIRRTRQAIYVTIMRVRELLLPWKINRYYIRGRICLCVRACVRAWACGFTCARVALHIQHATHMRHVVTSFVAFLAPPYFSTLFHKRHDFRK